MRSCSKCSLAELWLIRRRGLLEDLEKVIEKGKHAIAETQEEDEAYARRVNNVGVVLRLKYERTGMIKDLEEAIQFTRQAVSVTPEDHPDLTRSLHSLGNRLGNLYDRTGEIAHLEEAIRVARRSISVTPKGNPARAARLDSLGNKLERRYERVGNIDDLEEAIRVAWQAVGVTTKDHPDLASVLGNLGTKLSRRYERTSKMEDLEEIIQLARRTVDATPYNDSDLVVWLSNLGNELQRRYKRAGNTEDLEEAIQVAQQAVNVAPKSHPHLAVALGNTAYKLELRYECTGNMEDLEEAIRVARQAVNITPNNHPKLANMLNILGHVLKSRYECRGGMKDLEEAIQLAQQALDLTPNDHIDFAARLGHLENMMNSRYERTGNIDDLEEAIQVARQAAVEATPNGHPKIANILNTLEDMLSSRYVRTGRIDDLDEAIQLSRQAVNITSADHADRSKWLNNLGNNLESRYEHTKRMEDLFEAIQLARQAVDITPDDYPYLAGMLVNLGSKLSSQYTRTGNMEDLKEAIQLGRQAVNMTPKTHVNYAFMLRGLGWDLGKQYEGTRRMEDLEESIQVARQAVDATPKEHPDLAAALHYLGGRLGRNNLESRYKRTGNMKDLEEAVRISQNAWECNNAAPFVRIRASTLALRLLQSQEAFETAYTLAVEAIHLLPYVHNRSLSHEDQQYVVSHFSGLAKTACSLAVQTGKGPEAALELLEQGRGVILGLLMDDRSNTSRLRVAYPNLCAEYESLRFEVNKPVKDGADDRAQRTVSTRRREAIVKLEQCIKDIQQLPGLSQFHKGLTTKQMQSCCIDGSIVVVNSTDLRSDAIIVTANAFKVLCLPGLSAHEAKVWSDQNLSTTSSNDRGRKNKAYLQFLSWLWHGCVKPILDELHYFVQSSVDDLPRVWWIGAGLATSFPFHSAGDASAGPTECAYYRAISSYTPTIKALQYAQQRAKSIGPSCYDPWKVLTITMPKTPGARDLPATREETHEVRAALEYSASIESLEYPDVASTMARLQECSIAHFACHGVSNASDPSESGLILQTTEKTTKELGQDRLSVREVSQAHLSRAEIAYLSACSTAQNQAEGLLDEVLHVVSGFQVAGFRHVIGCLWPSDDSVCVAVARSFYSELSQYVAARENNDRTVALALHKAVMQIRESKEYRKRPLLWAQYVHFGA
ncbi:TPR-like protein [Paraphaeosphaeria sporulosa]|uniref:TPR-like protein n=1 Tax=Paraphaeosphaeria sporulosa TaxID=1460663 RepID=A0A177CP72_9PLEO|nr:TPR-like protein [Paraphaeosphaeria sporulosa]OAG09323.1 TPR-like protein [Paraphaeosphaeria sporulosa]